MNLCESCLNEHICIFFYADDCGVPNCPWYRDWRKFLRCDE